VKTVGEIRKQHDAALDTVLQAQEQKRWLRFVTLILYRHFKTSFWDVLFSDDREPKGCCLRQDFDWEFFGQQTADAREGASAVV